MVANMAKEADLLLHSFGAAREGLLSNPDVAGILQHHTSPVEAGDIFEIARPKLAVLIHMVLLGRPGYPPLTPEEVLTLMRESYQGPVVVAEDLMRFEVGDHISVIPWSPPAGS
jgi:ribonuclease Z